MTSNHQVHLSAIEAIAERLVRDRHEKGYAATPEADTLRLVIAELKDLRQEMGAPTLLSASARCPLCGQEGPHPHTPLEQAIYRNGLKAGSLHAETPLERAFAEEPQRTIVNDALLKIGAGDETPAVPLGSEPWRVSLPIITVQMLGDYGQEGFFEKTDQPVRGVAGVSWSQAAVDFACMLQGERQRAAVETTALPSAETYDSAREFAAELSRHTGGDPRRVSETVCETMRDALEGTSPRPWRNGDTWHCQCGAASTAETCTNPNCRRRRADEWGDVPAVEMSVAHSKSQQKQ